MTKSYVKYDETKNRVYLVFKGTHDLLEATRMRNEYAQAIEQAHPGFTVLADFKDYKPGTKEVQEVHTSAVHLAEEAGVSKVARVMGETPLGEMQISRIASKEVSYPSKSFVTVEEAEKFLDEK
ncbi:MAG: hypothetical protein R6V04_13010 [bacterium]